MAERPIRILLVDDHALFRQGLRQLLATTDDLLVVGEAASGQEAVELAGRLAPDVVLMDIAMPDLDGIAATATLRARFPHVRIVMLTMYDATTHGEAARAAGAIAYVVKSSHPDELFQAIRSAVNGSAPPVEPPPPRPSAPEPPDQAARLEHLERRLRWLEAQFAALAAGAASAPLQPNGSGTTTPVAPPAPAAPPETRAPAAPPAPPDSEPVAPAPRSVAPRRAVPSLPGHVRLWVWLAGVLAVAALAGAAALRPAVFGALAPVLSLGAGLAASALLLLFAAVGPVRPARAHLALLSATAAAFGWSTVSAGPGPRGAAAVAGLLAIALPAVALAWRRDLLLAAALALAVATLAPARFGVFPVTAGIWWGTGAVLLAAALGWAALRQERRQGAWEWLPLAPLVACLPSLLAAGQALAGPDPVLVSLPWLATVPVLERTVRTGRRSAPWLVAVEGALAAGTFAWLLRAAPPAHQASGLAAFATGTAVLAALLWQASRRTGRNSAAAELAAALAAGTLALAAFRHPEAALAPLTWSALAVALAAAGRARAPWRWAAAASFLAAAGATVALALGPLDPARLGVLLAALAGATAGGALLVLRPWWFPLGWVGTGTAALVVAALARLAGIAELALLSAVALGAASLARLLAASSPPAARRWFWFPAAGAGALALARAVSGPLSPARLGLALEPSVSATSEPVVAASILVAAALLAGRLLGRRWRWTAIAVALLVVAYALPAVVPDAALVVSWLALATALAQAVGGRPWR
ncbi:MAG: response regulator transcription factor [Thermomicrobium sp.]|nr:response regulator transcription factor [Thermomicrobium sp.]